MTTKKTKTKIEIKNISEVSVDSLLNAISQRHWDCTKELEATKKLLQQSIDSVLQLQQKVQNLTDSLNSIQKIAGK